MSVQYPPSILRPTAITAAMIGAGTTVAEPAAGETAWVSAGTYALGDLRIRATTHREYECVQAHAGRTALPEDDAAYWEEIGPTQRWAPFDYYTSTAATGTTSITYVLNPGFFNAIGLYGLTGSNISVTVKDAPGGTTIYSYSGSLVEGALGKYEYRYIAPNVINKLLLTSIPIRPAAEVTITVTTATGQPVGIGMINVGDFRSLIGDADWGGAEYGATSETVNYSYIDFDKRGNVTIIRGPSGVNMRCVIAMPNDKADAVQAMVDEVKDIPVSWVVTETPGFKSLNVFGLGAGPLSRNSFGDAKLNLNIKGFI